MILIISTEEYNYLLPPLEPPELLGDELDPPPELLPPELLDPPPYDDPPPLELLELPPLYDEEGLEYEFELLEGVLYVGLLVDVEGLLYVLELLEGALYVGLLALLVDDGLVYIGLS